MILDALLNFSGGTTGVGNSDGLTDSPTTGTQVSSNVLDLGIDDGIPTSANGGGARDIGVGDKPAMKVLAQVITAFADGTSLQVLIQGAPDDGTGIPGAYTTMYSSPVVAEASLIAGTRLAEIDMPRPIAGQVMPRFLRMSYVTVGTHTAGDIAGTLVIDRMDQPEQANAVMGGYPPGITIAN